MTLSTLIKLMGEASLDTLTIIFFSTLFSYLGGFPLGVMLILFRKDGLHPMPKLYRILDSIINLIRSVPFVVLILALMPVSHFITGTTIGIKATIVALVIGAIPFVARIVETALKEVDSGVIEAAITMGCDVRQLIFKVMLSEALPSLLQGLSLTIITLIGYSAMAGMVGGGGLGDVAVRYGYYRYNYNVMLIALVILVLFVQIVQSTIHTITRRIDRRIRQS